MQNALIQDAAQGGDAKNLLRLVSIDIRSGKTKEYAYLLTTGSGVSEILALNNHEFLVDERDGKGRGDGSKANFSSERPFERLAHQNRERIRGRAVHAKGSGACGI